MVFFTCNACGESMKKNQVEKHYKFQCKRCESLSCVDCSQVFWGEDYAKHTKCITEDAKYGGKDYKPKPNANKGERKQEEWTEQVQCAINKCQSNPKLKGLLEKLKDYENIPRKKPKFENFVKNSLRIPGGLATQMWDAISVEINITKTNNQANGNSDNTDSDNKSNGVVPHIADEQNAQETGSEDKKKLSKRERKEERQKSKNKAEKKDRKNTEEVDEAGDGDGENKRKKKKRKHDETDESEQTLDTETKKKKKKNKSEVSEPASKKSKKEGSDEENDVTNDSNDMSFEKKSKFNWEGIIVGLLKKAENNQLTVKKLRKKVLAEYSACHAESAHTEHKLLSKFNKKINNKTRFKVHKEKVTLKS